MTRLEACHELGECRRGKRVEVRPGCRDGEALQQDGYYDGIDEENRERSESPSSSTVGWLQHNVRFIFVG